MGVDLGKTMERTPEGFHALSWVLYVASAGLSAATLGEFSGTLLFLGAIVVIVFASSRKSDAANTVYASHLANITKVMWVNLIAAMLLLAITIMTLGFGVIITYPAYLIVLIYVGFKLIKGMMRLSEGQPY
jgi:uncharacterized membrane protein